MDNFQIRMLQLAHQGYCCSQVIMIMGLEMRGQANDLLVRAMAGLAYGCGSGRCSCGALTGGCCLLAVLAGQGDAPDKPAHRLALMLEALTDWFARRIGTPGSAMSCRAIVGDEGPAASRRHCAALVADVLAKVMEILAASGIDPMGE